MTATRPRIMLSPMTSEQAATFVHIPQAIRRFDAQWGANRTRMDIRVTSSQGEQMPASGRPYLDAAAVVEDGARIGADTKVWGQAQVRAGAVVGQRCVVGRGAFVDADVVIGDDCKIQNNALIYAPAFLEGGVFIGPSVVLTNDHRPRAINPDGSRKERSQWTAVGVLVRSGASIGAGAVCVAPVTIGAWAMIAAGATVTDDVPDYGLAVGTPARLVGWVGRAGYRLVARGDGALRCPTTGEVYREVDGKLVPEQ